MKINELIHVVNIIKAFDIEPSMEQIEEYWRVTEAFSIEDWEQLWADVYEMEPGYAKLIFLWDIASDHIKSPQIYELYLAYLIKCDCISVLEKLFLYNQAVAILFTYSDMNHQLDILMYRLYSSISKELLVQCGLTDPCIIKDRKKNLVFVMTDQFLDLTHGPTKTTLDRAEVLHKLGKNIIIINTAEFLGGEHVNCLNTYSAEYDESLSQQETVTYHGISYPYMQFDNNMPNMDSMVMLIEFMYKYKPEYVVNIGGASLCADVISKIVPVLTVTTVPSKVPVSRTTCSVYGKVVDEKDRELVEELDIPLKTVLYGTFTSSLKEQVLSFSKEELGISQDEIAIIVVGGRLGKEINNQFIEMIEKVLEATDSVLVIAGNMDNYSQVCDSHKIFAKKTKYIGFQQDMQAIFECMDIYINPYRTGGGTSVIEAMNKSIPPVTFNYGDVALGAGQEFCVDSYEEMMDRLVRLIRDRDFYNSQSIAAKKRADYMLDSSRAFLDILNKFEEEIKADK